MHLKLSLQPSPDQSKSADIICMMPTEVTVQIRQRSNLTCDMMCQDQALQVAKGQKKSRD